MTKETVLQALKNMPQDFHLDELFEKLIVIDKIEKGMKEIEEGKGIPHSEVKKMIESWKKK